MVSDPYINASIELRSDVPLELSPGVTREVDVFYEHTAAGTSAPLDDDSCVREVFGIGAIDGREVEIVTAVNGNVQDVYSDCVPIGDALGISNNRTPTLEYRVPDDPGDHTLSLIGRRQSGGKLAQLDTTITVTDPDSDDPADDPTPPPPPPPPDDDGGEIGGLLLLLGAVALGFLLLSGGGDGGGEPAPEPTQTAGGDGVLDSGIPTGGLVGLAALAFILYAAGR
jgi:hypothetical protein